MSTRKIYVPLFKETQVNKCLDDNEQPTGEIIPTLEVLQENMSAAMEAAMGAFGDEKTLAFLCFMHQENGEKKIGICCFPFNHEDDEELIVDISGIPVKPKFTVVGKERL